jgi:Tol biopolymer transport system component
VRLGVIFGTAAVGVVAAVLALVPFVLRHHPRPSEPRPHVTSSFWAIPVGGGAPRLVARLHGQYSFPVASVDGRSLLVVKPAKDGAAGVWSLPLAGGAPRRVGTLAAYTQPAWSPDQTRVALNDPNGIAIYDLGGKRVRRLTDESREGGFSNPSWGGPFVAFERETRPSTGWRLDLELWRASGTRVWRLKNVPFPEGTLSLAPDGPKVALLQVHALRLVTPRGTRLLATDVAGSQPVVWTPNGRGLLYLGAQGGLYLQDIGTGARKLLATGKLVWPSMSTDGRTVYVAAFGAKPAVSIPK